MKYDYIVGIDTGVVTGITLLCSISKKFHTVESMPIHQAMEQVKGILEMKCTCFVRFEDARLRKWFGNSGREQLQGAGSIKRDAKIWEDFLTELGIEFEMVAPKNNKTKLSAKQFKDLTGWPEKTNEHSRDSAMLVFNWFGK